MVLWYMLLRRTTRMSAYLFYSHLCAINVSKVSNHLDTETMMRSRTRGEGLKSTKKMVPACSGTCALWPVCPPLPPERGYQHERFISVPTYFNGCRELLINTLVECSLYLRSRESNQKNHASGNSLCGRFQRQVKISFVTPCSVWPPTPRTGAQNDSLTNKKNKVELKLT